MMAEDEVEAEVVAMKVMRKMDWEIFQDGPQ
jgi:hypothetical protein